MNGPILLMSRKLSIAVVALDDLLKTDKWKHFAKCRNMIVSIWCHESGFGKSLLALNHNNFAGIKMRKGLPPTATPARYTDWENEEDAYVSLERPEQFPLAWLCFVTRDHYAGINEVVSKDSVGVGMLEHLARRNYCASTPGVQRSHYRTEVVYRKAVQSSWMEKVAEMYELVRVGKVGMDPEAIAVAALNNHDDKFPEWLGRPEDFQGDL